ncbi:MAG: hypothetical protein M3416_12305, partial [Acidobacteriota bacterium]|nr:hypothetical protein [Acidobacteriota bacterium]
LTRAGTGAEASVAGPSSLKKGFTNFPEAGKFASTFSEKTQGLSIYWLYQSSVSFEIFGSRRIAPAFCPDSFGLCVPFSLVTGGGGSAVSRVVFGSGEHAPLPRRAIWRPDGVH